jgi:hypothetical protein
MASHEADHSADALRHQAEDLARQHLSAAGFVVDAPDPRLAWRAFRTFAVAPMASPRTTAIAYEVYQESDRDRIVWLSFVRNVESSDGVGWHVGYVLSRPAPESLIGEQDHSWWWPEDGSLDDWFAEVERRATFAACMALDGWTWEGFSD